MINWGIFFQALFAFIFAWLLYIIKEQRSKIIEKEKQLSEKKYRVYHEMFSIFFDTMKSTKGIEEIDQNDLTLRMLEVKKDLMIYAPDSVLKKYLLWSNKAGDNPGSISLIKEYLELFVDIRKDMGHSSTKIASDDILRSVMLNTKEFEDFKKQIDKS